VLAPRTDLTVSIQVSPSLNEEEEPPRFAAGQPVELALAASRLAAWRQETPRVSSPDTGLLTLLATSAEDLGVLRIFDTEHPDRVAVAAGAPWFMTLSGATLCSPAGCCCPRPERRDRHVAHARGDAGDQGRPALRGAARPHPS